MLVMVVFFIAFRWIHLSTPLIRLFLLVLILLLMPTLNFLPVWFALSLLRFRLPSRLPTGKSYCSRRFGGATCDDKSAQIYARFDKNDWRIQPAEFYRFHDAEVNTFGYF